MHINKFTGLLVLLCCELCLTIKVPVIWTDSGDSAVKNEPSQVDIVQPQNVQTLHQVQSIPIEYFQYTAPKPQFAADIAAFHGVNNPQEHYKAYPVKPFTGNIKPVLGLHYMLNQDRAIYQPYQNYVQKTKETRNINPTSIGYEIFHPYKAEEQALKEIYKDPILTKIRDDLKTTKNRLHAYEQDAGKSNITEDEYLEGDKKTEEKLFTQKNIPAKYEVHRSERRPIYYNVPPKETTRDHVLNRRFKHPWNQHNVKIRPIHYKPLKSHIHHLREQHAMKYDDERNEYPQVLVAENTAEPQEGQEIYERGKQNYIQLRNNVDMSINQATQQNRPALYQNLEFQKDELEPKDEEDDFIPVKNYAQVRKTETFKHVPRKSALDDAETFEEILNAPRLREAVKSTKAQTVYSEEGYEDSAYDHAGEQKHASDHEGHGGFLKQKENSIGLYKIPTFLGNYQDGKGLEYRDKIEHGEKWKNKENEDEEVSEAEDYAEDEHDESAVADIYHNKGPIESNRNKREKEMNKYNPNNSNNTEIRDSEYASYEIDTKNNTSVQHDVDKREVNFQVPKLNLDSTFLTEDEIHELAKLKVITKKDNIKDKYPYYFNTLKQLNKNSPLRYAENLNFMPKKSEGGTEFYDSRSRVECPEVDSDIDPIPQKLKSGENPNDDEQGEDESKHEKEFVGIKKQPRLKGLGDKIDCFKSKYFGENPLDSPFFKEEIISNPEPIIVPKYPMHEQLNVKTEIIAQSSNLNSIADLSEKIKDVTHGDIFDLLDKLRTDKKQRQNYFKNTNSEQKTLIVTPQNTLSTNTEQLNVFTDILKNINNAPTSLENSNEPHSLRYPTNPNNNVTYNFFQNKEEVTKSPTKSRKRRSSSFVYEPYKIIKDSQVQDSKKTTTTGNVSPLIKQLQSSKVVDRVSRSNREDKQARLGVSSRSYVDIGKKDRGKLKNTPSIVDVSIDQRRGEPRYEIRPQNHKTEYTPVENKRAMSREDYKSHATSDNSKKLAESSSEQARKGSRIRQRTTVRPFYDVSPYLPPAINVQNVAESNTVKKTVTAITPQMVISESKQIMEQSDEDSQESEKDDDDDVDDEEEEDGDEFTISTTTSTSPKPSFRKRTKATTTTEKPHQQNNRDEPERLRLITRFRNYKPGDMHDEIEDESDPASMKKYEDVSIPKYREKKKKSSESTLVTDTKKYGDDYDDDGEEEMRKEEVDALIGVKQNMDDYMPQYEKKQDPKANKYQQSHNVNDEDSESNDNDEEEDDDDDDENDSDVDESEDDDSNGEEYEEEEEEEEPIITTPEPTKRTLVRTTEAPSSTMPSYMRTTTILGSTHSGSKNVRPDIKPIVTRKKIEIHKELPVNKSSPHVTQFKQDIKEVEIIKEIPITIKRKPQKKGEALELYKDDNLAKDINKLGDVEIFNENIDLDKGRKHGGNYRKATKEDIVLLKEHSQKVIKPPKDAEASQSENQKHVEFNQYTPKHSAMHGGNLKSIHDIKRTKNSGRNAKLVELSDTPIRAMHGGNFKINNKRREGRRNEKLIEFDDNHDDERSPQDDDYKSSSDNTRTDRLHGGNYRSAKLIAGRENENDDIRVRTSDKETRRNSAALLNSFVQAVPVLTTTPGYILDPSKRMYYYVDA